MLSTHAFACEAVQLAQLKPAAANPRTHSRKQIRQIADSIRRFGFTNPVLVDEADQILAGHGRVAAAKELGLTEVPCMRLDQMSAAEKRAYVIADNKLALNAGWDQEILAIELGALQTLEIDMEITGFELPEIDIILDNVQAASPQALDDDENEGLTPAPGEPVTRRGDHWTLGRHQLLCGDAKDPAAVGLLMGEGRADMLFTDPPYNVPIDGHVTGLGKIQHREFAEAVGEMSSEGFTDFLRQTLGNAAAVCRDGVT